MTAVRVAYLVSRYPGLSHAFVEREIAALRARGATVVPFSLRAAEPVDLVGAVNRAAGIETTVLLDGRWAVWLTAHLSLVLRHPRAYGATLGGALRAGPRGARARLWQVFYWGEAVVLVRHLRARGLRHVHVHFANAGADVARRATAVGRAAYGGDWSWSLAMHGPVGFEDPAAHDLPAKAADAAFVACITDWCRREIARLAPTARTVVVRMGVDLDRYLPVEREVADRPLRVLFVGRLAPEKAPLDVLAAADLAGAEVVVAGDGALADEVRQAAGARVRVLGAVGQEDLPGWYAWADLLCLPSHAEGLPVVLMEALATGLPVVTTAVAGIPELVVDGETGLLVRPGDVAGIAAAFERLRDPGLRRRLGAAGRSRVQAAHDAYAAAEPLAAALADLPATHPAPGAAVARPDPVAAP